MMLARTSMVWYAHIARTTANAAVVRSSRSVAAPFTLTHRSVVTSVSGNADDLQWSDAFKAAVSNIRGDVDYNTSSEQLRTLIRTGLLTYTDLHKNPARFFEAHRILAARATELGPGFWIRFTVQYNLFAGTILGLASDKQAEMLESLHDGTLGCFGLTEKFAGVNSGFLVNTEAEWDTASKEFILTTPSQGAEKNWISQGYTAEKSVVLATLKVNGKNLGPHAFVMDLRCSEGKLVDGVVLTDMGRKTVGNDLDNASIAFNNVRLPHDALLSKFCELNCDTGEYRPTVKGIKPFTMIGQRLFSGRVAVAQAALSFRSKLFEKTREYSDAKACWAPPLKDGTPNTDMRLSNIPQLAAIYNEGAEKGAELEGFVNACETELNESLMSGQLPSETLIAAIAVAKVKAVEESIALCHKLKQEVGSFALMAGSGFEHLDFLQCCKFAEGDSRILMLKMARDRMRHFKKDKTGNPDEDALCLVISQGIDKEMAVSGNEQLAWDSHHEDVYRLAAMVMDRVYRTYTQK